MSNGSNDQDAFLEIVSGCTEVAATVDLDDRNWKPVDGIYTVSVAGVDTGTWEGDNGIKKARITPTFTIHTEGEFDGKTFTDGFWFAQGAEIAGKEDYPSKMGIRSLLQFATCMANREIRDPVEAIDIAKASVGELLTIQVNWRPTKAGTPRANLTYLSTVAAGV